MLLRAFCLLFGWPDLSERLSDHLRHPDRNANELLKLAGTHPELVKGLDILSMQHVPGAWRQIQISDGS
jgi:hypothetical protein